MPKKNIVLCSDGTGGTVMKNRGTNVWKLYEAVDVNRHRYPKENAWYSPWGHQMTQIAFYDDGIGTDRFILWRIFCGGIGLGLSRKVKELYSLLCRTYKPGDEIFLFGFSRGAYTVRILARLITSCGIINNAIDANGCNPLNNDDFLRRIDEVYKIFRAHHFPRFGCKPTSPKTAMEKFAKSLKDQGDDDAHPPLHTEVRIKFLGVWDTVSAIGIPVTGGVPLAYNIWDWLIFPNKFKDATLDQNVDYACQALSIDDERETFHPEVWDESNEKKPDRIDQVWFAGVHSNVGGGYPKQGMAQISLFWMIAKAELHGLQFNKSIRQNYRDLQDIHDMLYDSRSGMAVFFRYKPRNIAKICKDNGVIPKVHISAIERLIYRTAGYGPGNLPKDFMVVDGTFSPTINYMAQQRELKLIERIKSITSKAEDLKVIEAINPSKELSREAQKLVYGEPEPKFLYCKEIRDGIDQRRNSQLWFFLFPIGMIALLLSINLLFDYFPDFPAANPGITQFWDKLLSLGISLHILLLLLILLSICTFSYFRGQRAREKMQEKFYTNDYGGIGVSKKTRLEVIGGYKRVLWQKIIKFVHQH